MRQRLTFANVTSVIALFVALGGSSYAAIELSQGSVKRKHIAKNAVVSKKVKDASLLAQDFAPGQLPAGGQGRRGPRGSKGPRGKRGKRADRGGRAGPGSGARVMPNTRSTTRRLKTRRPSRSPYPPAATPPTHRSKPLPKTLTGCPR